MATITRKATLPIVLGIAVVTLLVAGYTYAILPWFVHYFDYYSDSPNSFVFPASTRFFRQYYLGGVPLGLCVIGYGVLLLRRAERRLEHVLWYAVLSVGLAASWFIWALLAERSFYELLFPA
ncbi:MAG: hypothetical protein NT154_30815 [Verrucomicrobia bacterium]|nr:hypothetical protein [Verrucomicrobiota bacterium]